jgi:hypothetical protein
MNQSPNGKKTSDCLTARPHGWEAKTTSITGSARPGQKGDSFGHAAFELCVVQQPRRHDRQLANPDNHGLRIC